MQKLESCNDLMTVAKGFGNYVYNKFVGDGIIFCHPIAKAVFLPKGINFIPIERVFDVQASNVFLTSIDGETWGFNFNEMIDTVSSGNNFYIADLKLNVYMNVEFYMLEDVIKVLDSSIDGIVSLPNFKWKDGALGELEYFTIDEFFSE